LLAANGDLDLKKLGQIIEVENFMRYWAIEGLIRFWDGYASNQNNFYYYVNPQDGRGYFIPWGADWAFTAGGPLGSSNQGVTAVYAQSILTNRLYHTAGIPNHYRKTMLTLLEEAWNEKELIAEIDRAEKMIASHLHESQKRTQEAMETMRDFINGRRAELQVELSDWPAKVPAEPRKPMYTLAVGRATGSFSTTWSERPPADATEIGEADIRITIAEKSVEFAKLGVHAQTFQFPRFGSGGGRPRGGRGPEPLADFKPPIMMNITGIRATDNKRVTVSLFVDRHAFLEANGQPIDVTGRLAEGSRGGFGFGGGANRSVNGRITLTKSGTNNGDPVVGSVDLDIVEVHGGFFNQRRRSPPSQRPGGTPRPDAGQPARPEAQTSNNGPTKD